MGLMRKHLFYLFSSSFSCDANRFTPGRASGASGDRRLLVSDAQRTSSEVRSFIIPPVFANKCRLSRFLHP